MSRDSATPAHAIENDDNIAMTGLSEEIQEMIDALAEAEDRLTAWELDFVDSISDQFVERGTPTLAQCDKLRDADTVAQNRSRAYY